MAHARLRGASRLLLLARAPSSRRGQCLRVGAVGVASRPARRRWQTGGGSPVATPPSTDHASGQETMLAASRSSGMLAHRHVLIPREHQGHVIHASADGRLARKYGIECRTTARGSHIGEDSRGGGHSSRKVRVGTLQRRRRVRRHGEIDMLTCPLLTFSDVCFL